jgi:putative heme iron utilization protein
MAAAQERDFYSEARLLIRNAKTASLATAEAGIPHAALVTLAYLPDLTPILLLSQLAIHTRHLQANPACALLLTGEPPNANPQTTPRLCLSGTAAITDDPTARAIFLERHPYAAGYADFTDFAFWKVFVTNAYYIGGFAAASHLAFAKIADTT